MSGPRRPARGALLILAGLLVSSGAIRIGSDAGQALALGATRAEETPAPAVACACGDTPAALAAALLERESRVSERERQLEDRLHALAIAEQELEIKLQQLISAEASLEAAIADAETASSGDLERLTAVYENMKPAQASALFEEMAPAFAAGFVGRMRPDAAAAIMAGLDPTTAYAISVVLAGRNAEVPTE